MSDGTMICPRDGGPMVTFSRAGVQVDQCETCKGIFLDRGELEQLAQAEQNFYQQPPPPQPGYQQPRYQQPVYQQPGYQPPGYYDDEHHGGHHGGHSGYRRRGFMHELFD